MKKITKREILKNIEICEKQGKYDEHTIPLDWDNALPVDKDFKYLKLKFGEKLKTFFQNLFIVKPFTRKIAKKEMQIKIIGAENLKNINSAIITCNHIHKFDCLLIKYALRHHRHRITAGAFNNQKGWFGEMMRVGGLMPFSSNFSAMSNFNKAMEYLLQKKYFIVFYPEHAMWLNYKKPRPLKNGAFHYATKHNQPLIPMFITLTENGKFDEENLPLYQYTLNILKPIYPQKNLSNKENIEYMKKKNFEMWKNLYEEFYKTTLSYPSTTKNNKE